MNTYTYTTEQLEPHTAAGKVWHDARYTIFKDGKQIRTGVASSLEAAIEKAEATIIDLIDLFSPSDDDYGLTNEQGLGFGAEDAEDAEHKATTPRTRYVEDEFGEDIVQEVEIIEDVDSGLIPRPDLQDVDSGFQPERDADDPQLLFKGWRVTGVWVQAVIVDGICTATHWHAPFADLEGSSAAPSFAGDTIDELHTAGFCTAVESGLQAYVNANRAY